MIIIAATAVVVIIAAFAIALARAAGQADRDMAELLAEGWLLALAGGALGLLLAFWTADWMVSSLNLISPSPLSLD